MNSHTSSPKRCMPIMLKFAKENAEITKMEIDNIKAQIDKLEPTTMFDGKVCQALSENSSSATCYICGANPSEMNNLQRVKDKNEMLIYFD